MKKQSILTAIIALAITISSTQGYAQLSNDTRTQLITISNQMYEAGDNSFILVQAFKDGLIKEEESYNVTYNNGVVSINDKILKAPLQQFYKSKLDNFLLAENSTGTSFYSIRGDGFTLAEIMDEKSQFRKHYKNKVANKASADKNEIYRNKILNEMFRDKLVDTTIDYNIAYDYKGLYINDKKQTDAIQAKYKAFFKNEVGFAPTQESDGAFTTKSSK